MATSKIDLYSSIKDNADPVLFRKQLEHMKLQDAELVKCGLEGRTQRGSKLLEKAAQYGRKEILKILLEFGAERRPKDTADKGYLAVHAAAEHDHAETLQLLLKKDKGAIKVLSNGWSPLHFAMYTKSKNAFTYIVTKHKKDCFYFECQDSAFPSTHPLYFASYCFLAGGAGGLGGSNSDINWSTEEMMSELLKNGCSKEYNREHLVIWAARDGSNFRAVKNLVEFGQASESDLEKAYRAAKETLSETKNLNVQEKLKLILEYLEEEKMEKR